MVEFPPSRRANSGVILVMAALFVLLFLSLAALSLGLGFVAYQRSNFRRAANAASLAAIEEFSRLRDQFAEDSAAAQEQIENRAWTFLEKNQPSGQLGSAPVRDIFDVDISYGRMISRAALFCPEDSGCPCDCPEREGEKYPCFVACSVPAEGNAIKVQVASKQGDPRSPILSPLGVIFGRESFELAGSSVAMIVPRCTAFLIDVSPGVALDTHDPAANWMPGTHTDPNPTYSLKRLVIDPVYNALYAYKQGNIETEVNYPDSSGGWACSADSYATGAEPGGDYDNPAGRQERVRWCSLRWQRGPPEKPEGLSDEIGTPPWFPSIGRVIAGGRPMLPNSPWKNPLGNNFPAYPQPGVSVYAPKTHYRSDYKPRRTKYGDYLVDSYVDPDSVQDLRYGGPEPLQTIIHAFHSALITLQSQQTNQDLVMAKAFTGKIRDEIPCREGSGVSCAYANPGQDSFTNDLRYLIQVTNFENRGTFTVNSDGQAVEAGAEIAPNFLTHGWFPRWETDQYGGTNLVKALVETIHDIERECPSDYKKLIILATDGMSSCYVQNDTDATPICPAPGTGNYGYPAYQAAEGQLISDDLSNQLVALGDKSVLAKLKEDEISLTVMLTGDYVEPNFCNVYKNADDPAKGFLDFIEASDLGFGWDGEDNSTCAPDSKNFFNVQPSGADNATAFMMANAAAGVIFRRPNGALGRMVLETGGLWCPLQELDPRPGCYDGNSGGAISDSCREANDPQTKSVLNYTKAQMAALCASRAVGYNPFALMEPVN